MKWNPLYLPLVLGMLLLGCGASKIMYGARVLSKVDAPPGLVLEGEGGLPVECYPPPGDSLADVKVGQFAVFDGDKEHEGHLAVGVHNCHVTAVSIAATTPSGPGIELRQRAHAPPQPASAPPPAKEK